MIAIIDYGAGNLRSIQRALQVNGADVIVTNDPATIQRADAVVLPGVGHAGHALREIDRRDLTIPIREFVATGKPFLGICLGMQLLFQHQQEGDTEGFGFLRGSVRLIEGVRKLPHIGWNQIHADHENNDLDDEFFYFVHSFCIDPVDADDIFATATYGETFAVMVKHQNIWGTQFHPEKSGPAGLDFLATWLAEVDRESKERWAKGTP